MASKSVVKVRLTRKQKRLAKPGYHHKGRGEVDGAKIKKRSTWWEGAPMILDPRNGMVSTRYSSKQKV